MVIKQSRGKQESAVNMESVPYVLVVDDEELICWVLKQKLAQNGPELMIKLFDPKKIIDQTMAFYKKITSII